MIRAATNDRTASALLLSLVLLAAGLAGCTVPPPVPEDPPLFAQKWGSYGPGNGQFNVLTGVAVDAAGNVYATDSGNDRVQKFSGSGVLLTSWGGYGTANCQMKFHTGIAVGPTGDVFVLDSKNYRVQKFTPTGAYLGQWGSYGTADGQFRMHRGIAVDSLGNVFVSDAMNHRVQKFTSAGVFLSKWGSYGDGDGQMKFPRGVAVDAAGFLYVADYANHRVLKFDGSGVYLGKWGGQGAAEGQFSSPYGVAVDHDGDVYVTDVYNHRVQKFNPFGGFLSAWGAHGSGNGAFDEPYGIAVDSTPQVFVVDGGNDRIQKFRYVVDSIDVGVLVDGAPWAGPINYTLTGPQSYAGTTAPHFVPSAPAGSYTLAYLSGGPPGAYFLNSTFLGPKTLTAGGAIEFTLNFTRPTAMHVQATLNGLPWSGPLNHSISGFDPNTYAWSSYPGTSAPQTTNVTPGTMTVTVPGVGTGPGALYYASYVSGGPPGANLTGTTSTDGPILLGHHTKTVTFHFRTYGLGPNTIVVNATLDGLPWTGNVSSQVDLFAIPQPPGSSFVLASAPQVLSNLPQQNLTLTDPATGATGPGAYYVIQYLGGGPPGATFAGVAPTFWTVLHQNGTKTFTLQFITPPATTGSVVVDATLDGLPWTGAVAYTLAGPQTVSGSSASQTHAGLLPGSYTLAYVSGGPPGASLAAVAPTATQAVTLGNATTFTMHFRSKPVTGALSVNATLDGAPWTGPVNYTLSGAQTILGTAAPQTFVGAAGTYTLAYGSGGPAGAVFSGVTPTATQTLAGGGTVGFTLAFKRAAPVPTGSIEVLATAAGAGGAAPWTGPVSYTLTGPQNVTGAAAPQTFSGLPVGTYTLTYVSGGPPGMTLFSTTPSATQTLTSGGTLVFRLNFR
jgi:hypothetical protein